MTSPLWGKYCDGGHYCSAPKECCTLGCCYHTLPTNGVLSLWFLGHWYFWALVMASVLAVLCACSMWRRCWRSFRIRNAGSCSSCCGSCSCSGLTSGRDERASEPDSTGSCYAPPHYSRCNSFHHAPPPPYAEVTSKPDLYPLVINYNGETGMKRGGSASYLMVQYFRNYILRPSGSISATSTIDSLSSSFICNAANEANTVIPPPYSCTGSLEGFTFTANTMTGAESQIIRSTSSLNCNDFQQTTENTNPQQQNVSSTSETTSVQFSTVIQSPKTRQNGTKSSTKNSCNYSPIYVHNKTTSFINNMPNTRIDLNNDNSCIINLTRKQQTTHLQNGTQQKQQQIKSNIIMSTENSLDSGDEHNFSELLNLSVCVPSNNHILTSEFENSQQLGDIQHSYNSITNSVTVSDISSLANLGTPDSPPRATSPTIEIRELLDKIQQLPQQRSPAPDIPETTQIKTNRFFNKKSKTLYMPLNTTSSSSSCSMATSNKQNTIVKLTSPNNPNKHHSGSIFAGSSGIFSYAGKTTKGWLSRSAPTTPCGNFVPLFPSQRKQVVPKSHMGSKSKMDDASALLTEYDVSDEEQNKNEQL